MNLDARIASRSDRAVQRTDDDAAGSKLSAVIRGYYEDPLLPKFYTKPPVFRLPFINIGTYCRVQGINHHIAQFLQDTHGRACSIVSLGAGSDTRGFKLVPEHKDLQYYELDFAVKTNAKQKTIDAHPELKSVQESGRYHLIPADLRQIDLLSDTLADLGNGQPVLLISECCLCYLPLDESDHVLEFFGEKCRALSVVLYEPMSLKDEFGRVMAENMAQRGLVIPTLEHYSTLETQKARLIEHAHLKWADSVDVNTVFSQWLSPEDRQRIARLEFLDEVEEMQLLLSHYCIAWGSNFASQ